jgi:aminobenzoyl-glutamate utilization protein B
MTYHRATLGLVLVSMLAAAQMPPQQAAIDAVERLAPRFKQISRQIWENPELGWQEKQSSALLRAELEKAGFRIRSFDSMPTAFVAEWGEGAPVIGILGEYDALPGLSQEDVPERKPRVTGAPGHGCGHNLFGAASALAAVAVKERMQAQGLKGTIRFYGTPAEEGGGGKIFLIRAGAFRGVDVVLAWHPGDFNAADDNTYLANISSRVRFRGTPAHAAGAPEAGRSALDAVELTAHAINLLREHVPQETRMHYIVTSGGAAANIVPDFAEMSLIVRHPDLDELGRIWQRVKLCIEAGALATETKAEIEITSAYANFVLNPVLRDLLDRSLRTAGGVRYTDSEREFIEKIRATLGARAMPPLERAAEVLPPKTTLSSVSTDVGDVSWVAPTGHFTAATMPPGVPLHTWQSTACAGTEIGRKGMMVAARTLALATLDLLSTPELVKQARAAFEEAMRGRAYRSLLPEDRRPGQTGH